jgi:hypothetical protein
MATPDDLLGRLSTAEDGPVHGHAAGTMGPPPPPRRAVLPTVEPHEPEADVPLKVTGHIDLPLPDFDDDEDNYQPRYQPGPATRFTSSSKPQHWSLHPFGSSRHAETAPILGPAGSGIAARRPGTSTEQSRIGPSIVPYDDAATDTGEHPSLLNQDQATTAPQQLAPRQAIPVHRHPPQRQMQQTHAVPASNQELVIKLLPPDDRESSGHSRVSFPGGSTRVLRADDVHSNSSGRSGQARTTSDHDRQATAAFLQQDITWHGPPGDTDQMKLGIPSDGSLGDLSFQSPSRKLASHPGIADTHGIASRPVRPRVQENISSSPKITGGQRSGSRLSNISKRRSTPHYQGHSHHFRPVNSSSLTPASSQIQQGKSHHHRAYLETVMKDLSSNRRKEDRYLLKFERAWEQSSKDLRAAHAKLKSAEQLVAQLQQEKDGIKAEVNDLLDQRRNRTERERALEAKSTTLALALKESDEERRRLVAEAEAQTSKTIEELKDAEKKQAAFEEFKNQVETSQGHLRNRVKSVVAEANKEMSQRKSGSMHQCPCARDTVFLSS